MALVLLGFLTVTIFSLSSSLTTANNPLTVQTSFGAGKSRKNFILDVQPVRTIQQVSLTQCLQLCKKYGCQSFNYGFKECSVLSTYYCAVSAKTRKPMKKKVGYTYYDVAVDNVNEISVERLDSADCKDKQACSKRCDCVTTTGIPCFFPVDYNGKTYHECTNEGWKDPKDLTWCSTNNNRQFDKNKWGYCGPACPIA